MPIKIHHGPPGSYKTAGAMGDDFLREAREGRVIVTNVRGVSRERCLEEFPDLPQSFDVIHVDDKTEEGRKRWATWFHWVPHGAFLFIDEVQDIWPKRWRESDIRALDYPGGVEQATQDDRPYHWEQAFDKHRHWNWDMVLTTPNYAKVRDDVKGVADMAFKHKNLALVGWTGRYIEASHLADDSGKAAGDFLNVQNKKVPPYVFRLYDSTQTGLVSDTKNGFNVLKNPRVLMLLGVLAGCLALVFANGRPAVLGGTAGAPAAKPGASPAGPAASAAAAPGPVPGGGAGAQSASSASLLTPFDGPGVYIAASLKINGLWRYAVSFANTDFTNEQLLDMGYTLTGAGSCGVLLKKGNWERFVTCGRDGERARSERPGADAGHKGPVGPIASSESAPSARPGGFPL